MLFIYCNITQNAFGISLQLYFIDVQEESDVMTILRFYYICMLDYILYTIHMMYMHMKFLENLFKYNKIFIRA